MVEITEEEYEEYLKLKNSSNNKFVHCNCCNTNIKYLSINKHIKSKKHLKNNEPTDYEEKLIYKRFYDLP